ncbi:MAG: ATP-dependent sacrificial sulfur transferase LarE [Deltaproteobacteria bacterium]|nr:ATP-dependent sacrificial sulfur transferase LarE [Deltaproteobacteria bacterium]
MDAERTYAALLDRLKATGGVAVAFSGGVDSSLLLKAARDALRDRVVAVIVRSCAFPVEEEADAIALAQTLGVRVRVVGARDAVPPSWRTNPPDRCYHCKLDLLAQVRAVAVEEGLPAVAEGSGADDVGRYRPGLRAVAESGAIQPLLEVGLDKAGIRHLAHLHGLPVWNRPSWACLATRFPYGEPITLERLARVERAERGVRALGLGLVRVRDHGALARLEVASEDLARFADPELRKQVVAVLKIQGYTWSCLDLEGYREGAMDEALPGGHPRTG